MIVTAWNNGTHHQSGAGYGFTLKGSDRDEFFKKDWKSVFLTLDGATKPVKVNISKSSFWERKRRCCELISKEIGLWLREKRLNNWIKGNPPKFSMEPASERRFTVGNTLENNLQDA